MVFLDSHWIPTEMQLWTVLTLMIGQIQAMSVTAEQVQATTHHDPVLSQVFLYVQEGWPAKVNDKYKPFYKRKNELSIEAGCLLWGNRVIVPEKFQPTLIQWHSQPKPDARAQFFIPYATSDLKALSLPS